MKVSELSRRSGVPVPTIKFYIREGLLPPGERTAKTQASYSDEHVETLELVRTLHEGAGLGLSTIARVMAASRSASGAHDAVRAGLEVLGRSRAKSSDEPANTPELRAAWSVVASAAGKMGWKIGKDDIAAIDAARALVTIRRAMPDQGSMESVTEYARIAEELARIEIPDDWNPPGDPSGWLKYALLGTFLFEPLILALRRMAHAERSRALLSRRASPTRSSSAKKPRNRGPRARP